MGYGRFGVVKCGKRKADAGKHTLTVYDGQGGGLGKD